MPLVTFNTKQDRLLAKTKKRTIRHNVKHWQKRLENKKKNHNLFVWWRNPRLMRRFTDCYKMGIARWTRYKILTGAELTEWDATLDGFETLAELLDTLAKHNGMTVNDVLADLWIIIEFEWVLGPFTQAESNAYGEAHGWNVPTAAATS